MIVYNAAAQIASLAGMLVVQTVYVILVARILGVEDFGRFSFVYSVSQILLIGGDLGLHNTALRKISFRPDESSRIFPLFISLKLVVAAGLTVLVTVLAIFLRETPETRVSLFLFGLGLFFHSQTLGLNIGFQAHGKLYLASLNSLLLLLFQALIGLGGLLLGGRLAWLGFAYLASSLLALSLNWAIFRSRVHPVRPGGFRGWRTMVWESFPLGIGSFFDTMAARLSFSLLAALAGNYDTGIFSAAARITSSLRNLPMAIFSAVLPALAQFGDRPSQVRLLLRRYLLLLLLAMIPITVTLFLTADRLILLIYGPNYAAAAEVLRLLSLSLVPACFAVALSSVMVSQSGLYRRVPWVTGLAMVVNIGANWLLIPVYGSTGAALSQLLTESLAAALYGVGIWAFLARQRDASRG